MNKATVLLPTVYGFTETQPYSLGALSLGSALYHSNLFPQLRIRLIGVLDRTASPQSLAESIASEAPDVIALGIYIWNERLIEQALPLIRARVPQALIVLGGLSVLYAGRPFASRFSCADLFVRGEGEEVLEAIVRKFLTRPRDEAIRQSAELAGVTTHQDFGSALESRAVASVASAHSPYLKYTRRQSFFDSVRGSYRHVWWELSRGCVYSCSFCAFDSQALGFRCLPQARLHEELDVFQQQNTERVFVTDPIFGGKKSAAMATLRYLELRPLTWRDNHGDTHATYLRAYFRPEMIDEEYARLLSAAQISLVQIGLQTTNLLVEPTVRDNNLQLIAQNATYFRRHGLPILVDLIVGCPGDDMRGLKDSIRFVVEDLQPLAFRAYRLTVIPGTPLAALAEQRGRQWLDSYATTGVVKSSVSFTEAEVREMSEYATTAVGVYNYIRDCELMAETRPELMGLFDQVFDHCRKTKTAASRRLRRGDQSANRGRDVMAVMKRFDRNMPKGPLVERSIYGGAGG